ncbi:MAG: hypothetical protein JXQ66_04790, partial [Campylobacterales bacterium]|nr:hypothetical protein [Campylobacterales bacterium]
MKKVVIFLLMICNFLNADYNQIKIQDYVNIVAMQNSINIVTDKELEKTFDFFINKEMSQQVSINVLQEILFQNGYTLQRQSQDYYIIKSKDDILINKIEIFNIQHANTNDLKDKADEILKGYFKSVKTVTTKNRQKNTTPLKERTPNANDSSTKIQETEERINYAINVLDNKTISVTYKDEFVPQVIKTIIHAMDTPKKQIKVKVKIYEVNTDALKEFSTNLGFGLQSDNLDFSTSSSVADGIVTFDNALKASTNLATPIQTIMSVNTLINALEKQGDAKLTAEPSVYIYEGKKAKLTEGKTYPIRSNDTQISNNI